MMVVHLLSPDGALRPALHLELRPQQRPRRAAAPRRRRRHHRSSAARVSPARLARSGQARGLRPDRRRRRRRRCRSRTCRSRAAPSAQPPAPSDNAFQLTVRRRGASRMPSSSGEVIVRSTARRAGWCASRTWPASSSARRTTSRTPISNGKPAVALGDLPAAGHQRPRSRRTRSSATMEELKKNFPPGIEYHIVYNPTEFIAEIDPRGLQDPVRGGRPRRHRRHRLPAVLAHGDHPDRRDPGLADRHLRGDGGARLLDQQADPVRPGARHRHRRRRRDRRGRERRAQHRPGLSPRRGGPQDHGRGRRARSSRSRSCLPRSSCRPPSSPASRGSSTSSSRSPSRSRP